MKITKTQLKQIIKEEIHKVLNEGLADAPEPGLPSQNIPPPPPLPEDPLDILKEMIIQNFRGQTRRDGPMDDPKNIEEYFQFIVNTAPRNTFTTAGGLHARLKEILKKSLFVVRELKKGLDTGRAFVNYRSGPAFYLPAALGFEKNQEFGEREEEWEKLNIGFQTTEYDHNKILKDLSETDLFFDLLDGYDEYMKGHFDL
jgi:hypothetical protein